MPNGFIASLDNVDREALLPECRTECLTAPSMLDSGKGGAARVYFLMDASVALLMRDAHGCSVAVGLVGTEGAVGLHCALGVSRPVYGLMVQASGTALTIRGPVLQGLMKRRPTLHLAVSRYLWSTLEDQAQFAVAMRSRTVSQLLAGWILGSQGPRFADPLLFTQEHMARMLGVRRSSVSVAASELRDLGLIDYSRGRVRVRDAAGLVAFARR